MSACDSSVLDAFLYDWFASIQFFNKISLLLVRAFNLFHLSLWLKFDVESIFSTFPLTLFFCLCFCASTEPKSNRQNEHIDLWIWLQLSTYGQALPLVIHFMFDHRILLYIFKAKRRPMDWMTWSNQVETSLLGRVLCFILESSVKHIDI